MESHYCYTLPLFLLLTDRNLTFAHHDKIRTMEIELIPVFKEKYCYRLSELEMRRNRIKS